MSLEGAPHVNLSRYPRGKVRGSPVPSSAGLFRPILGVCTVFGLTRGTLDNEDQYHWTSPLLGLLLSTDDTSPRAR